MGRAWRWGTVLVVLLGSAAVTEAGVNGKAFAGTVDFSNAGPTQVRIQFNPLDNFGVQDVFEGSPEQITYQQLDLYGIATFWSASNGFTTWSGGFELLGIIAVADVNDATQGVGRFIGFATTPVAFPAEDSSP